MKLLERKSAFFLLVFALLVNITACNVQQKIVYTHIGISDKPICTIEILREQKEDTLDICKQIFLVDKDTFRLLESYIKKSNNHLPNVETTEYPYGTFKVLLSERSKKYEIIMYKEESITFFSNQLSLLHSNTKLYNKIEVLLKRLKEE